MSRMPWLRWIGTLGLDDLPVRTRRRSLLVLMYHYFDGDPGDPLVVPGPAFREQMTHVAARYRVVPLHESLARLARGEPAMDRSVAITVDDVGEDFATHAWPVLRDLGLPVTLAVCPGLLEGPSWCRAFGVLHANLRHDPRLGETVGRLLGRPALAYEDCFEALRPLPESDLTRLLSEAAIPYGSDGPIPGSTRLPLLGLPALRELVSSSLVEIASHTMTHPVLARIPEPWLRWEIGESRRWIDERLGPCRVLVYPGGAAPDPVLGGRALLGDLGYRWAFGVAPGFVDARDDPAALRRIAILGGEDAATFRARAGGWPAVLRRRL